jgi:hypothetical protein
MSEAEALGTEVSGLSGMHVGIAVVAVCVVRHEARRWGRTIAATDFGRPGRDRTVLVAEPVAVGVLVVEHAGAPVAAIHHALAFANCIGLFARASRDTAIARAADAFRAETALALVAQRTRDTVA